MSSPLDGRTPKYRVEKHDGSPVDPGAKYLVLRIDGKPKGSPERRALQAYLDGLYESGQDELEAHLAAFFKEAGR